MLPPIEILAAAFLRELAALLTREEWHAMRARNRAETDPAICHSHDFCDANMPMLAAWEACGGEAFDPDIDAHAARWSAAWEAAMPALRADEQEEARDADTI